MARRKKKKSLEELRDNPRTEFASTTKTTVPSWVRDEQIVDKGGAPWEAGIDGGDKKPHEAPEHFKLLARAQEEWWQYDLYARITMLYGVMQFLAAVAYYCIGTVMAELRGFWISWSLPLLFMTAQALILRLDILRAKGQQLLPHLEWLGHLAPYSAIVATTLDYRWWYSSAQQSITWIFVMLAFLGHFLLAMRMLDLAWPQTMREGDMPDEPGKAWWPNSWKVPSAFTKALWILAPPKELEKGQHDLVQEMETLRQGMVCRRRRARGSQSSTSRASFQRTGWGDYATSSFTVKDKLRNMDRVFKDWFESDAWRNLTEKDQRHLNDLHSNFQHVRQQLDGKGFSGSNAHADEKLHQFNSALNQIEDGLVELEASNHAQVSNVYTAREARAANHTPFSDFGDRRAADLPWELTRIAILTVAFCWLYMMVCTAVEISLGGESPLKPPGEPPWIRDQKRRNLEHGYVHLSGEPLPANYGLWSAATAIYSSAGSSHGSGGNSSSGGSHSSGGSSSGGNSGGSSSGGHSSGGGSHGRRLEEGTRAFRDVLRILPSLDMLSQTMNSHDPAAKYTSVPGVGAAMPDATGTFLSGTNLDPLMSPHLKQVQIKWPSFFEPHHLACNTGVAGNATLIAVTPHGFSAALQLSRHHVSAKDGTDLMQAKALSLEGVAEFGPLAGVGWSKDGLLMVTKAGRLLQCPGDMPVHSARWSCQEASGSPIPAPEGTHLLAAAFKSSTIASDHFVALTFDTRPDHVLVFRENGPSNKWILTGELHVPVSPDAKGEEHRLGLSFTDTELLITTSTGEVRRHNLLDGSTIIHPSPVPGSLREWRSACQLHTGQLFRLSLRPSWNAAVATWEPEISEENSAFGKF